MIKNAFIFLGTLLVAACGRTYSPISPAGPDATESSTINATVPLSQLAHNGFSFNALVSGAPTGSVAIGGGGSYDVSANAVNGGGSFRCIDPVLQGPLSISLNPNDPGACGAGEGTRWNVGEFLASAPFKCVGGAEAGKTGVSSETTVVFRAEFFREGNGNVASFKAPVIVSLTDIAPDIPGVQNVWIQNVGCGTATILHFSN